MRLESKESGGRSTFAGFEYTEKNSEQQAELPGRLLNPRDLSHVLISLFDLNPVQDES